MTLTPGSVNWYDAIAYVIKPATESAQCSYAEHIGAPIRPVMVLQSLVGRCATSIDSTRATPESSNPYLDSLNSDLYVCVNGPFGRFRQPLL